MKFTFGDIVIVNDRNIGVVVKSLVRNNNEMIYEVYVRNYNQIIEYKEKELERYMVRHKELSDEEREYQDNALEPFIKIDDELRQKFLAIWNDPEYEKEFQKWREEYGE